MSCSVLHELLHELHLLLHELLHELLLHELLHVLAGSLLIRRARSTVHPDRDAGQGQEFDVSCPVLHSPS